MPRGGGLRELDEVRALLATGQLAEARRAIDSATRHGPPLDQLRATLLLIEIQILMNTRLELARSVAVGRRLARDLGLPEFELRVRLHGVEAALLGDTAPSRELERIQASGPVAERAASWFASLLAVTEARNGNAEAANAALVQARKAFVMGGAEALQVVPWVVRAEMALLQPERALRAARYGEVLAEALGLEAHRASMERLAAAAESEASPAAQESVLGLVELASATAGQRDVQRLLGQVCQATMQLLQVDRAYVVLRGDAGALHVEAGVGRQGEPRGVPSRSVMERALRTGREVVSNDLDRDGSARSASIVSMGLRSVICAPMLQGSEALGVIYGDSERVTEHELKGVAWLARGIAGIAAVSVANAKRLDAAEQASQHGREIAHDVRNMLNLVRLSAEDMGEADDVPAWAQDLALQSREAARRMQSQLEQLLAPQPVNRQPLALHAFTKEIAAFLHREAREHDVRLLVHGDEVMVPANPDELGRAVTNLLANAIKYSPRGGTVEVSTAATGSVAILQVRDHGPGIPAADLPHIFESGRQGEGAASGYGLGLGIAERVVEAHGGDVAASNAQGGGASFVVRLPRLRS